MVGGVMFRTLCVDLSERFDDRRGELGKGKAVREPDHFFNVQLVWVEDGRMRFPG